MAAHQAPPSLGFSRQEHWSVMTPSSYQIGQMAKDGMIDAIDHSKCPNVKKNFDASYATQVVDPTFSHSVPYSVTYTGFIPVISVPLVTPVSW